MLYFKSFLFSLFALFFFAQNVFAVTPDEGVPFTVVVIDSAQNTPLQLARVSLRRRGAFVSGKVTNPAGRAIISDVTPGWYTLIVHLVDYVESRDSILI